MHGDSATHVLQVWKHTTLATQTGSFILSSEILRYFTSFLFSRRFIMQGSYRNSQLKKLFFVNKFRVAFHLSRLSGPTSQFVNGTHSSQNWFWPEQSCSWIRAAQFSRSGRPKRGNWESCGEKMYALSLDLSI